MHLSVDIVCKVGPQARNFELLNRCTDWAKWQPSGRLGQSSQNFFLYKTQPGLSFFILQPERSQVKTRSDSLSVDKTAIILRNILKLLTLLGPCTIAQHSFFLSNKVQGLHSLIYCIYLNSA